VRFFNRLGRNRMEAQLRRLLADFRFAPLVEVYADRLDEASGRGTGSLG